MRIHKEGFGIIRGLLIGLLVANLLFFYFLPVYVFGFLAFVSLFLLVFTLRFFRVPVRVVQHEEGMLLSPCDGTVVVIEEVVENEFFKEPRIQVSIFMSVWNVHINWFSFKGTVEYFRHHQGKYLVAWHPKSSELNERTSVVVRHSNGTAILFRQIAGYVARRIICYAKEGTPVNAGEQMGFIKFGSRVDIFLPLDAKIEVSLNQKVVGTQTNIARFK
ncbi:phosphatidylserine decarboxylase family protein [Williamwhitmania taraxaci]|uniref:Phosphatidylserine decarboxylase proenzyme n=1 Tax=Williamwhitmania taraxaci TaxID=1640674 RepID=A0A1G6LE05_9BACT|nr:phosphatidylserine decarboxylase family protein [Williamwhitmania taraxaci]SDC41470.1 phosphatidylserine decarboxylase [Williamwhitmania taraxaci]